jgi:hypothetical protein
MCKTNFLTVSDGVADIKSTPLIIISISVHGFLTVMRTTN